MSEATETLKEALKLSDESKARTFDYVVGHLANAVDNDPRKRERTRAMLALVTIAEWGKLHQ